MSTLTMQAIDCVQEHKPMNLSLLLNESVRMNLLRLSCEKAEFALSLMKSLNRAMQEYTGIKDLPVDEIDVDEIDQVLIEKFKSADEDTLMGIAYATDITVAMSYVAQDLLMLMSSWGFRNRYNLPHTDLAEIYLTTLRNRLPGQVLYNFFIDLPVMADDVDWNESTF